MATNLPKPQFPPQRYTLSGRLRRVGVEIEFANVDQAAAADIIEKQFGGHMRQFDAHRIDIEDTAWGRFVVELDTQYAHRPEDDSDSLLDDATRELLGDAVSGIVPTEIVCPPIPFDRLGDLDAVFEALRREGAKGTQESAIYGFGLHLNVELARQDMDYLLAQFRAYLLMSDWLRQEIDVDLTRRLLPHANPFPKNYVRQVVSPDYRPDLGAFVTDYVAANPDRNRELDLYPLFRHLMPELTDRLVNDPRIKARPAFHYRLPNASLSQTGWTAVTEWNRWVEVERLASDSHRLGEMVKDYIAWYDRPAPERWLERITELLRQ